jgi:hypothetical protein
LATFGSLPLFFIHQPLLKRRGIATLLLPVLNLPVMSLTVARSRDRPLLMLAQAQRCSFKTHRRGQDLLRRRSVSPRLRFYWSPCTTSLGHQSLAVTAQLKLAHLCQKRFSRPPRTSRKHKLDRDLRLEVGGVAPHLPTDTCRTCPDLTEVIDAWPTLTETIRAGIMAMVRASKPTA